MDLHNDERGFALGWMAKLLLFLALLAIAIYDASALAVNAFQLDSFSNEIAVSVSISEGNDRPFFDLEREARKMARTRDAKFVELSIDDNEEVVRVTIRRDASTLVVSRITQISHWGRMSATGKSPTE